jgi:hypothetical protein
MRRHICGLVNYRLEADLASGRIIRARNLVGIDILDARPVILLLISQLGVLAQANDCASVHTSIPDSESAATLVPGLLDRDGLQSQVHCLLDIEFLLKDLLLSEVVELD